MLSPRNQWILPRPLPKRKKKRNSGSFKLVRLLKLVLPKEAPDYKSLLIERWVNDICFGSKEFDISWFYLFLTLP